jgi:hypothetical protein
MSKEAMKLALEAVKELHRTGDTQVFDMYSAEPVIKALEEALAKQEQGEPVAWEQFHGHMAGPFYQEPQQRTWVGLTDEDDIDWEDGGNLKDLVKAIEAKLKDKNT